jgi:hypothetical protein
MFKKKEKTKETHSKNKLNSKYKAIVGIDAYSLRYYKFRDNKISILKKPIYNTANYVTSYISNKDLITSIIEINSSIEDEDINDTIELKAYEELGLDQALTYNISHTETIPRDGNRQFHVFILEEDALADRFKDTITETKFLDFILPIPLLYKALYNNKILHNVGVDCFTYFTRFDTVVVIYKDGEYLYSKTIEHSLVRIYEKYLELPGEKIEEEEFYKIMGEEGLKSSNLDYQKDLMKIFGEVFIGINDILIYVKRAFDFKAIDKVYIGSEFGPIAGLDEYSQTYLGQILSELNFDYEFVSDEWYLDQFQCLMALSSVDYQNGMNTSVNLTQFKRPPPFAMRPGGQFIISTTIASIVGIAWPSTYLIGSYLNKAEIYVLEDKEQELTALANKYKKIIKAKTLKIQKLDKEINELDITYNSKIKTLSAIFDKKVNYKLKSESLYRFAGDLKKFDVRTDSITSEDDSYKISLISENSKNITRLIKTISEKYFKKIREIDIAEIQKNQDTGYYTGILKVKLK